MSSKEYVCCVCDPSMCLGVPSIYEICVCMRDVISEFNSEIEDHLRFVLLYCFCVLFCVLCVLGVVCMWSVFCLLGCCVCLRGE